MIIFATMAQSPFQTFSQHWMTNISCHLNTCIGQHQDIVPTPRLTLMVHLGHLLPMILVSCSGSILLTAKGNLVSKTLTLAPKTLFHESLTLNRYYRGSRSVMHAIISCCTPRTLGILAARYYVWRHDLLLLHTSPRPNCCRGNVTTYFAPETDRFRIWW